DLAAARGGRRSHGWGAAPVHHWPAGWRDPAVPADRGLAGRALRAGGTDLRSAQAPPFDTRLPAFRPWRCASRPALHRPVSGDLRAASQRIHGTVPPTWLHAV